MRVSSLFHSVFQHAMKVTILFVVLLATSAYALCPSSTGPPRDILICNGTPGIQGLVGTQGPPGTTYLPVADQGGSWLWDWTVWFIKLPFQVLYESLTRAIALTLNYVFNMLIVAAIGVAVNKYFGKAAPVLASAAPASWASAGSGFQLGGV